MIDKKLLVFGLIGAGVLLVLVLGIHWISGGGSSVVSVNIPTASIDLSKIVPSSDVQGKDLRDVPRPEGFVRAEYREDKNPETGEVEYIEVVYRTFGNKFDDVYSFYLNKMQEEGWNLVSQNTQNVGGTFMYEGIKVTLIKEGTLEFSREDSEADYDVTIDIKYGEVNNKEITEVSVGYNIYKKYEGETPYDYYKPLNKEPQVKEIAVYPSAVYYNANKYTMGNTIFLEDDYYVNATVEEVYDFYTSNIPEGYVLQGSSLQQNEGLVQYVSEDGSIVLSVSIQEETTYGGGVLIKVSKVVQQT